MFRRLLMLIIAAFALQMAEKAAAQDGLGAIPDGQSMLFGCLNTGSESCAISGAWIDECPPAEEQWMTFEGSLTQFYQGVSSGGLEQQSRYGGHGDYDVDIDFGRLCDVDGFSVDLGVEHRFGQSVNDDTGSVIPSSLLANLPTPETNDIALTKVLFKQKLSDNCLVFFGKLDTLEYDTNAFADGSGRDRFFSTSFNYNPIATRTIPFSTLGAGIAVFDDDPDNPLFTFAVLNAEETPTTVGLSELFADGAAMFAELRIPTQLFGRSGNQRFGGSWSGREYVSLDQDPRVILPNVPIQQKSGSWALFWNADHHLWEDPCSSDRGWGIFGRAGISDGNPNPIAWFLSFGIGGHSPLDGRVDDTFGIGWYYSAISDELGPVVSALIDDGQGVEMYYSIAFGEQFHVSPNLQIVEPNRTAADTAIVPGLRARIDF